LKIKIISGASIELSEDQLRKAFESNLFVLEEGLEYADYFILFCKCAISKEKVIFNWSK